MQTHKLEKEKRGGGMDSKDSLSSDCVFVRALAGGILCMEICVCRVCVLHVLIKKCPVVNTTAGWELSLHR